MTTTRVEIEELETTKSEKLLALVLAVFLLIGGIWAYQEVDDLVRDDAFVPYTAAASPQERAAIDQLAGAEQRLGQARADEGAARTDLELRREAYRTALDARRPAAELERSYRQAQERFERSQAELRSAGGAVEAARPAAAAASERIAAAAARERDRDALVAFALRLGLAAAQLVVGLWLLARLRRRGSRYLPVAFATVATAAVLSLALAADYVTDYVDPLDLGPLLLALFGIVATLLAFYALQRYLARRLPYRRVRKRECPFCSYPVRDNEFCEGCGRAVVAGCARCSSPRRVGAPRCGACGAA